MSKTESNNSHTSQDDFTQSALVRPDFRIEVGILAGNDISALKEMNIVVQQLVRAGYKPVIYMAEHKPSQKATAHQLELQTLAFYERYITNNVIFPILESTFPMRDPLGQPRTNILYTPDQLAEVYDLEIRPVEDINAPEFVEEIRSRTKMPILLSKRCYQIAHQPLIDAQKSKIVQLPNGKERKGVFWNIHPGKLPEFQGILGPLYAMEELQRTYAWTLHEVIYDPKDPNKGIDKGNIITQTTRPIDYTQPVIDNYLQMTRRVSGMIYDRIEDYLGAGLPRPPIPQDEYKHGELARYFTHPDFDFFQNQERWPSVLGRLVKLSDEKGFRINVVIRDLVRQGITELKIADPVATIKDYPRLFAAEGDQCFAKISQAVKQAVQIWEQQKNDLTIRHHLKRPLPQFGVIDTLLLTGGNLATTQPPEPSTEVAPRN